MKKISIKIAPLNTIYLSVLLITVLAFTQTSNAQSSYVEINDTQKATAEKMEQQAISPDAYKRIIAFFKGSTEVSIERFNQQLIEVNIGARSFFSSNDGRYIYVGKVIDTEKKIDISEQVSKINRLKKLAKLDDKNQLSFPATGKELFSVTLFTDIDCGYCRRFHQNMAQYNALGIRVNYMMFPRAGKNSTSYDKTAAVLCSKNPQENISLAMQGEFSTVTATMNVSCQQNLDQQMQLAAEFGISATPTMFLPSGALIAGALNPEQLLLQLQQSLPNQ